MTGHHHCPPRTRAPVLLAALVLGALAGCSGAHATSSAGPVAQVPTAGASLQPGAYPVASVQARNLATPTVTPGGYALVAAGDPVNVTTSDGAHGLLNAVGPDVTVPSATAGQPYPQHVPGVLTVEVTATNGPLTVAASDLQLLDEAQRPVATTSSVDSATATPGHSASIRLSTVFHSGHMTLTWRPAGTPTVTWDFVVELD